MGKIEYIVSADYSRTTGLRHCDTSDFSGEDFYHTKLNFWFKEAYKEKKEIFVVLDGGDDGYGPSFLDEAFGNLIYDFGLSIVSKYLRIEATGDPLWKEEIENLTFPIWEQRRKDDKIPTKTVNHQAWYRLVGDALVQKVWIQKKE